MEFWVTNDIKVGVKKKCRGTYLNQQTAQEHETAEDKKICMRDCFVLYLHELCVVSRVDHHTMHPLSVPQLGSSQ